LLKQAPIWFNSDDANAAAAMQNLFAAIAGEPGKTHTTLTLNHRRLQVQRMTDDVIWFDFRELCDGPRGQADYIAIAKCYHTVFVSDLPVLNIEQENQARRFISMIDEFYDRGVKLVLSAAASITDFYTGSKLSFEIQRTQSRLIEMQSQEYLARPHQP
jgi:cell division protein ZapE